MKKKVVDILPPKSLEKEEKKEFRIEIEPKPEPKKLEIKTPLSFLKKGLISVIFILFLGGAIFCFLTLSKANIEVWPDTEPIALKTKLTVDKEAKEPNFVGKVIPGQIFEKEKTSTENFSASGKVLKEGKAEGMIRVYNEYSTYSQVLVATTRFVSADGKIFRTLTKVTIPGGSYEKGKFVPGELDIKVVADQSGPEYNIGPSTFSIPGFAGSDRYTKLYAKSFQSMEGGFREEVSQVTQEDLEKAKSSLTQKAKEECETALKNELQSEKISSESKFLEKAIQTEIVETFSLVRAGDTVENFNFQVKAKSKTLIFKKEDFNNFIKEFIRSQVPGGKTFYEESLVIDVTPETINLNSGKLILALDISTKIYSNIDISNLKSALRGKSSLESKIILENQPNITKAKIELWPFWVRKVPDSLAKINFTLKVD